MKTRCDRILVGKTALTSLYNTSVQLSFGKLAKVHRRQRTVSLDKRHLKGSRNTLGKKAVPLHHIDHRIIIGNRICHVVLRVSAYPPVLELVLLIAQKNKAAILVTPIIPPQMSICSRSTATPGRSDQLSALNITVRNTRCRDLLIPSVVTIVVPLRDEGFCRQPH